MSNGTDVVQVDNVEIIRDVDWALFCRIGTKFRFVPQTLLGSGSVRRAGERGTMTMPRWLALGLGVD